jgi:hypothetical protein
MRSVTGDYSMIALQLKTGRALADFYTKIKAFMVLSVEGRIRCGTCGHSNWECLQVDHIQNDGEQHRRKYHAGQSRPGGGHNTYRWILKYPKRARKKLQLLCANCHQLKSTYGFVPEPKVEDEHEMHEHQYELLGR